MSIWETEIFIVQRVLPMLLLRFADVVVDGGEWQEKLPPIPSASKPVYDRARACSLGSACLVYLLSGPDALVEVILSRGSVRYRRRC